NKLQRARAAEFTRKQLRKMFDNPRNSDLEVVIRKRITPDEARHITFFPDEDQAAFYPALIKQPPSGAPEDHPQRALQV
ncbi:unnamed protein product, partial [Sphacelaria rigidula]